MPVLKILYRAYLVLSTFCFAVLGYHQFLDALGITYVSLAPYIAHCVNTPVHSPHGHIMFQRSRIS